MSYNRWKAFFETYFKLESINLKEIDFVLRFLNWLSHVIDLFLVQSEEAEEVVQRGRI